MRWLLTGLLLTLTLVLAPSVDAKPHMLTWTHPTAFCDSSPLDPATELVDQEVIYSTSPMPMPSDTDGPCAATPDPDAPAGSLTVPVPVADEFVILNLQPNVTYYARSRIAVTDVTGTIWSAWSNQVIFTVPKGRPNTNIMAYSGLFKLQYDVVEGSTCIKGCNHE